MGPEIKCDKCQAPMVLASFSRGFQTYRCARGCADSYHFTYEDKPEGKHAKSKPMPDMQMSIV